MFQRPRGTRDFGADEMRRRLAFERLCDAVGARHGFSRVATPTFESLDLFTAKSGEGVVGELYAFEDKGGRPLTLRPELTAPVMRMVANEMRSDAKPLRLSYFGSCFRYEEFKTGRYREFWQYGCEVVGASGPLVEAEVMAFAIALMQEAGVIDWHMRVGHVGILGDLLAAFAIPDANRRNVMRLLDKGAFDALPAQGVPAEYVAQLEAFAGLSGGSEMLPEAKAMLAEMGVPTESLDALGETLAMLESLVPQMPELKVDLTVARGLDYYTGAVFEFDVPEMRGEGQVLGGGAYRLMHLFDLPDLDPCCGFGLGFDRVLIALERQAERTGNAEATPPGGLAVIPFKIETAAVLPMVGALRAAGETVTLELRARNIGRSMGWADASGAEFAMVIGPRDLESGEAKIKRLADGEQVTAALTTEAVADALTRLRHDR